MQLHPEYHLEQHNNISPAIKISYGVVATGSSFDDSQ